VSCHDEIADDVDVAGVVAIAVLGISLQVDSSDPPSHYVGDQTQQVKLDSLVIGFLLPLRRSVSHRHFLVPSVWNRVEAGTVPGSVANRLVASSMRLERS